MEGDEIMIKLKDLLTEARRTQLQIPESDKKMVNKILKKLRLKPGKHYDFGAGKGSTFILDLDKKVADKVLELLIQKRVKVKGL